MTLRTLQKLLLRLLRDGDYTAACEEMERFLAFDAAVGIAYQERTGLELEDGGAYTAEDAERAREIMLLFPETNR